MQSLDFDKFFYALHGCKPLPWQSRLAAQVIDTDTWPSLIDLPTASGKTACIDIAVFHLAHCADQNQPWRAARRIVFVVDRRIIVDSAYERAKRISDALHDSSDPAIVKIAAALRKAGGDSPLQVLKLRGGMPSERGFAFHPAQPMIMTSTIDQVGSRLLFRGYGLSRYAQPLHAGLLGHDALILLDEAHLGTPFMATIAAIRREQARAPETLDQIRPVQLVPLSATATPTGDVFRLDARDLKNRFIAERRDAPKPTRLVKSSSKPTERLQTLLRETLRVYSELGTSAPAVAVIVNRVSTARALFGALEAQAAPPCDVELLIGRSRALDRDAVVDRVAARVGAGRDSNPADRGIIIVATQTIEVGADLDFQGMVTECAALDALRQRFGRLDRLGKFRRARAVIVGTDDDDDDPIYGAALSRVWEWLNDIARTDVESPQVDFSIAAMEAHLSLVDIQPLVAQKRELMQLTPTHVELLCQTDPRPQYDPDISALLHGFNAEPAGVQVIWREHIPVHLGKAVPLLDDREPTLVRQLLTLVPPTSLESLTLPLCSVRAWLNGAKVYPEVSDLEGVQLPPSEPEHAVRTPRYAWRRRQSGWEAVSPNDVRPGDTLVVPAIYGGCDQFGFAPQSSQPVTDLSVPARRELKREAIILITREMFARRWKDESGWEAKDAWKKICDACVQDDFDQAAWLELLTTPLALTELMSVPPAVVEVIRDGSGMVFALVFRDGRAGADDLSDDDLSSSRTTPVALDEHNAGVGARAREFATAVGVSHDHVENLGQAGDSHDIGKAEPRFQRLLRGGDERLEPDKVLAKGRRSLSPLQIELGERHEAYSVALLKSHPQLLVAAPDRELTLYLVGSHHGRGRAMMPSLRDEGSKFAVDVKGRSFSFNGAPGLGALGSQWPALFWRLVERYGPWGLAYLEALLRLADYAQSRSELKRKE